MTSNHFLKNASILFFVLFLPFYINAQSPVTLTTGSSWTVPSCVTSISVECWGGGGGGGYSSSAGQATGGGGGGAYAHQTMTVTPGQIINYSIGTSGSGSSGTHNGGDTWFSSNTTVLANGGSGVADNSTTAGQGGQASASIGNITYNGGNGGTGSSPSGGCSASGGGGGGAGSGSVGNNGGNGVNGSGGCIGGGTGGSGGTANGNGSAGGVGANSGGAGGNASATGFGGGGGGGKEASLLGSAANGGNGGNGGIIITYTVSTPAATISYTGSSWCSQSTTVQTPTITGTTGGTFSALPSGLSINTATGAITPSTSTVGMYTVTYSLNNSCGTGSTTTTVNITNGPTVSINATATSFCQGDSVILTASGGTSYQWSNGFNTASITVIHPAVFSVTATDAGGCSASASTNITENQLPIAVIQSNTGSFCDTAVTTLLGSGGVSFVWSTGSVTDTILVAGNGTYSLTVTDANGCNGSVSIPVQADPLLGESILPDSAIVCESDVPLTLYANTPFAATYLWNNDSTTFTNTVTTNGVYSVTISNSCQTKTKTCFVEFVHCDHFKLPSAFSPNGDGINDIYKWVNDGILTSSFTMHIHNRWGQKVFETNDSAVGWDGKFNGEAQPIDSYVVFIEISYPIEGGQTRTDAKESSFTLLR